jgi:hypothetical protein
MNLRDGLLISQKPSLSNKLTEANILRQTMRTIARQAALDSGDDLGL